MGAVVLCVTMATLWNPVIQLNINIDVAVKGVVDVVNIGNHFTLRETNYSQ